MNRTAVDEIKLYWDTLREMITFELQPSLKGKLIELRPLKAEDFEDLFSAASDPLIWQQHPQKTRHQREVFQTFFDGAISSGGAFAVVDLVSQAVIGSSRYYALDVHSSSITIGYTFLSRQFWGGKYNSEMKQLMLKHAFQFVEQVFFEIGISNIRSRTAIERIGATLFGEARLDEKPHVIYRIGRSDFVGSK